MEYRLTATLLDTLGIAMCVFDAGDRTVFWNETFLRFFPEHDGFVHAGEPYAENLRRFYRCRLPPEEQANIERYVADGVFRHRNQTRPYVFQHRGRWFRVTSAPGADGGRLRIWLNLSTSEVWQNDDRPPEAVLRDLHDPATADMLENVGEGVCVLGPDDRIVAANDRFLRMYGLPHKEAALGRSFAEIVRALWDAPAAAEERTQFADDVQAALVDGAAFVGAPFVVPLPGPHWIRVAVNRTAGGQSYAIHADITATKRQEQELREAERHARDLAEQLRAETRRLEASEHRVRTTFTESGIASLVAQPDGTLVDANLALARLLGCTAAGLVGRNLADFIPDEAAARTRSFAAAQAAAGPSRVFDAEVVFRRVDGSHGVAQFFYAPVLDGEGRCMHLVGHLLDITQRKADETANARAVQVLREEALHDGLTGLRNRRSIEAELDALATRGGAHALLFIDLDGFKAVNDAAGHAAGDDILRQVALTLRGATPDGGTLARLGGDEFVVLLRDCARADAAAVAAAIVRTVTAQPYAFERRTFHVGASVGVRAFRTPAAAPGVFMGDADAACYAAKRHGRGRVEFHGAYPIPPG
ncbi:diguanylate cyclase domain-containing protein [Xylophilus sp.]|uniref:diguanylate cyclase domain-containing protein n=1 Tax=Xylophilus sp. TaxID=2653893 RepID=UPI0013BC2CD1|nr:diguanylate cyclase [Xylophilus sp.]KAF1048969.1 MAG: putative diguanylate cyclase DgcE [Xylophilus sp.]